MKTFYYRAFSYGPNWIKIPYCIGLIKAKNEQHVYYLLEKSFADKYMIEVRNTKEELGTDYFIVPSK